MRRRRGPHGAQLQLLDRRRRTQTGCQRGSVAPCPSSHHQQIWWHERSLRHVLGNRVVVGIACCRPCHYLRRSAGSAPSAPTPRRDLHVTSWLASQPVAAAKPADEAALRPRPRQDALRHAPKLTAPAVDRRQVPQRRPRQLRIRRAAPSARAAVDWLGGRAVRGRRGAQRRSRWRSAVILRGGAAQIGAVARL